jgi:hypothetical protein
MTINSKEEITHTQVTSIYTDEGKKYLKKNPTWHLEHASYKSNLVLRMINKHQLLSKVDTPFSVAEVGCGGG